jgi:hypothetical protein
MERRVRAFDTNDAEPTAEPLRRAEKYVEVTGSSVAMQSKYASRMRLRGRGADAQSIRSRLVGPPGRDPASMHLLRRASD